MLSSYFSISEEFNKILNDPSLQLETVLDQETVVDELKHRNQLLIKYLTQDDIIKRLVSYIVEFPKDLAYDPYEPKKDQAINKFPLIATELLSTDNEELICKILGISECDSEEELTYSGSASTASGDSKDSTNSDLAHSYPNASNLAPIYKLMKFVESDGAINFTMANYFSRVTRNLLYNSPIAMSRYIFQIYFDFFKKITSHVYCDSIQDILGTLLKLEPAFFKHHKDYHFTEQRLALLKSLVENIYDPPKSNLDENYILDNQINSGIIVGSMIVQNSIVVDGRKILAYIISKDTLDKIFTGISDRNQVGPSCAILIQLCDYFTEAYAPKSNRPMLDLTNYVNVNLPPEFDDNDPFLVRVIASIPKITDVLKYNPRQSSRSNWPSSMTRLKLLELSYSFIKLRNKNLDKEIIESDLLQAMLEILGYDIWSNILHHLITKILIYILNESSDLLRQALFEKFRILNFIVEAVKELHTPSATSKISKTVEKGNIAHLILLANAINNSETSYIIQECENSTNWTNFVQGMLTEKNIKYTTKIGGDPDHTKRVKIKMKVDEEDVGPSPSKLEEVKNSEKCSINLTSSSDFNKKVPIDDPNPTTASPSMRLGGFNLISFESSEQHENGDDGSPKTPHKKKSNASFEGF